jgi:hypothetical protein
LGFVALNPTYILPVLLRNAKPNNGRFRNRAPKVSIPIKLAVFSASSAARMKLRQNGTVSFTIKLAAVQTSDWLTPDLRISILKNEQLQVTKSRELHPGRRDLGRYP